MADYEELTFYGVDGEEAENFLRNVRKRALMEGKQRDNAWIADFAGLCFAGDALRWFETLDDDVQLDWGKLRRAILDWLPKTTRSQIPPRTSSYGAPPEAAPAASPAPPPAAPAALPAAPPLTPVEVTALPKEKSIPLLEGVFQITSATGNPMGYLSRMLDADQTYPRTSSRSLALRVRFALLPDRQAIKLLDISGNDQFLGLTWRNLTPTDWNKSEKYTAALVAVQFVPSECRWKSGNAQDKAATQHHIWTLSRDRVLQAEFTDNNGGIHRLQSVATRGERIRFVKDMETFTRNDPNYSQVRLVFVQDD